MDSTTIISFIDKLTNQTISGSILWRYLSELETVTQESNKGLYFTIFQTEYHRVDFFSSYYGIIGNGTVYLINETFESGRDGSITSGYNLYLQKEGSDNVERLHCPQGYVYQIVNAVNATIQKQDSGIDSFISDYLDNPQ